MSEYLAVADLPAAVRDALSVLNYGRKDIRVVAAESVTLAGSSGDGYQAYACLINLADGTWRIERGSWGGANMFARDNAVDNDTRAYPLPAHGVAVTGSRGGGQPVSATLHIPASMVARMLPAPAAELSKEDRDALYCHKVLKGGAYRREELRRRGVRTAAIDALVERGLLTRNRAGAVQITTAGKNALGDYRGY